MHLRWYYSGCIYEGTEGRDSLAIVFSQHAFRFRLLNLHFCSASLPALQFFTLRQMQESRRMPVRKLT